MKTGENILELTQWRFTNIIIQFAVSSNLSEKQSHRRNADPGKRGHCIFDLPLNLILKKRKEIYI